MELRSVEQDMSETLLQYQSLRLTRISNVNHSWVSADWTMTLPEIASLSGAVDADAQNGNATREASVEDVLHMLESLRARTQILAEKATKFRKRMRETDPITSAPRYGEKTMNRVKAFLDIYESLSAALSTAFGEESEDATAPGANENCAIREMQRIVERDREAAQKADLERQAQKRKEDEERAKQKERKLDEEKQREGVLFLQRQREEHELANRAQEARQARLSAEQAQLDVERREREARERADRDWMAGIAKGVDGVRQQLLVLKDSTASQPKDYATALTALHTLFSQIVAHPEEVKFRRVRRDHPGFNDDIGRHQGGRELLIAAGFRLGAVDDVPCFISVEPNIESDMDGWSAWFDLLKATVEIIEEEMIM